MTLKEKIVFMYVNQGLSDEAIAKELNVDEDFVADVLDEYMESQ